MNVVELTPKDKTILDSNLDLTFLDELEDPSSALDGQEYIKVAPLTSFPDIINATYLPWPEVSDVYWAGH